MKKSSKINLLSNSQSSRPSSSLGLKRYFVERLKANGISCTQDVTVGSSTYDVLVENVATLIDFDLISDGIRELNDSLNMTVNAYSNNYSCIHVFDWDDVDKICMMLSPKTRLYARKCSIELVDQTTANSFLKLYHLQGSARGQTVCYGMYFKGNLVSVMTFGAPRYNKNYQYELIRLCYHPSYTVVGGSEKLWKQFVKEVNPVSVLSYCDRSKFTGNVYYRLGMTLKSEGQPSKHWYSETEKSRSKHITNNFLLQHGYDQIFKESYGKGTDNEELIMKRGYLPIYDCGQMTFEWSSEA